nr:MAG TPA: hypothetical protein [Crassvirales sp.]
MKRNCIKIILLILSFFNILSFYILFCFLLI